MSDAPIQTILQQRDARPVSGEHLEVLGKKAAADFCEGKVASLHESIIDTVRGERLSPEQVKRVVEFTNQDAYLQEFRKLAAHRVVHFDGGPADPAQVLQDLNDGGGGSVYDRGTLDYHRSPRDVYKQASAYSDSLEQEKTASAQDDTAVPGLPKLPKLPGLPKQASPYEDDLWALFGQTSHIPFAEPLRPLVEVRSKLASGRDQVASELDALEIDFRDACDQLYGHVKQAALEGTSLGDVVTAWASVSEEPAFMKAAFSMMTPRMRRDALFAGYDAIGESLTKKASGGDVNTAHPVVTAYGEFVDVLSKLAQLRELYKDLEEGAVQAETLLKQAASGGVLGAAKRGIQAASAGIDQASPAIARFLVGHGDEAAELAPTLSKGMKATGAVGGALAANAAVQSVTDRPLVRSGLNTAQSLVPGTAAYNERRYRTMTGQ